MISDIWNSVRLNAYERTASPLMGSFITAWAIINYQFILILLSGLGISVKLQALNTYVDAHNLNTISLNSVGAPLLVSLFYIFVYPHILNLILYLTKNAKIQASRLREAIMNETFIEYSVLESHRKESRAQIAELDIDLDRKDEQIKSLADEIDKLKGLLNEKGEEITKLDKKNEEIQADLTVNKKLASEYKAKQDLGRMFKEYDVTSSIKNPISTEMLMNRRLKLFYNPDKGLDEQKIIFLAPNGVIGEDSNENESRWRVTDALLELLNSSGDVQNRFKYNESSAKFESTNQMDLGAIEKHNRTNQYLEEVSEEETL
jgi:chromosome segregation ATPase